jgi:hypothetical protein
VKEYDAGFQNSERDEAGIGDNRRTKEQKNIYESTLRPSEMRF